MNRVLVVEDDKVLAKLLAKKIEIKLELIVDIAHSLQEARLFTAKYKYFLALLDLNLPDAPYGEVVDVMLNKKIPSLVLSGILDKDVRATILEKDIIDYVKKGTIDEIRYIVSAVERLSKNINHKVLIVDDSLLFRNQMKKMVEHLFFQAITVAHGEEALEILKTNPNIKIVLTDYNMPVMDGLELTKNIRKLYSKNELSIIAISTDHTGETSALFLKHGATDYIHKPFSKEEFSCRLNNAIEALENILTITHNANRDFLTGLYNRRYFFDNMLDYFVEAKFRSEFFCISMIDIDNFKAINDTYGHDIGDDVIVYLSEVLTRNTDTKDIVARFGGEEFCIVFKDIAPETAIKRCENIREKVAKASVTTQNLHFTISIGLTLTIGDTLNEMITSADMLLYKAKNNGKNRLEVQ